MTPNAILVLVGLLTGAGTPAADSTQSALTHRATVSGSVLDATSGEPLPGATVQLTSTRDGAPPGRQSWSTVTDPYGRYRLEGLPLGRYRVRVRRLGYRPAELDITIERTEPFRVSVGLEVLPIVLEPKTVSVPRETFGAGFGTVGTDSRRAAVDNLRHQRFLSTDVRILTHGEVVEGTSFGETDIFRAMQHLPGVTTRDDYTAELWTRGAPWSHTRVYYDGLPVYNPLHTSGLFSAVNPDALGSVVFHPGGRSARLAEGAAGVVELTSRTAGDTSWSGRAELSAISLRAAADRRFAGGRGGVMASVRRSYIDFLMNTIAGVANDPKLRVPYAFADATLRLEVPLSSTARIDLSGMWESDQLRGDVRNLIRGSAGSWGNSLGGIGVTHSAGPFSLRHHLGHTAFRGNLNIVNPLAEFVDSIPSHSRMENRLDYTRWETVVEPGFGRDEGGWAFGAQIIREQQRYDGPFPRPYPSNVVIDTLRIREIRTSAAFWGEVRWSPLRDLTVDTGLRIEFGDSVLEQRPVALSPRLTGRYTTNGGATVVSASFARVHQYSQAVAPAGPAIGPDLHLTDVWLLAGANAPPIRSDIFTVGAEHRVSDNWRLGATLHAREGMGITVPDPTPGLYTSIRPVYVSGVNRAWGVEWSARKLAGPWTGAAAFTWGTSRMASRSSLDDTVYEYPAASDRRVVFNATARVPVTRAVRVGGAISVASGASFTRFILQTLPCDSMAGSCPPAAGALTIEEPNAARGPAYGAASLTIDWHREFRTWGVSAYLRVTNVLNRRNAVTYSGSLGGCEVTPADAVLVPNRTGVCDLFDRGLPFLPLAGVAIAF